MIGALDEQIEQRYPFVPARADLSIGIGVGASATRSSRPAAWFPLG